MFYLSKRLSESFTKDRIYAGNSPERTYHFCLKDKSNWKNVFIIIELFVRMVNTYAPEQKGNQDTES